MKTRFNFDSTLANGFVVIFIICFIVTAGSALLIGRFLETIIVPTIFAALIVLFWIGFKQGTFIIVNDTNLFGTTFFIRGKTTLIGKIESIHQRGTFGGLMAEVYMKVRTDEGVVERGLVNKPALKKDDFNGLLNTICEINPNILIDANVYMK